MEEIYFNLGHVNIQLAGQIDRRTEKLIITIIIQIWAFSYNDTNGPSIPNLNNY